MNWAARFQAPVEFRRDFQPQIPVHQVVFDWDGTLSFIRAGWGEIMRQQWLEHLPVIPGESVSDRSARVDDEIWQLNGRPSIHQAARLAQWIQERGGSPKTFGEYEEEYQQRLGKVIRSRCDSARQSDAARDAWLVPGARKLIDELSRRGIELHILSGTQRRYVVEEAHILGIHPYFEDRIHGPAGPDDRVFTKRAVLEGLVCQPGASPAHLMAFGDGQVEISETKALRGTAVAVATDEEQFGSGRIDGAKRDRLMGVGADACLPDFRDHDAILSIWFSHALP